MTDTRTDHRAEASIFDLLPDAEWDALVRSTKAGIESGSVPMFSDKDSLVRYFENRES